MKKLRFLFLALLLSAMSVNMFAQVAGDTFWKTLEDGVTEMRFQVGSTTSVKVIDCNTTASEVTVPQTIMNGDKTFTITSIGSAPWSSCVTKVNLPEGLLSITYSVFNGSKLEKLEIPASVTNISDLAFHMLSNLTAITVRSGNTKYKAIDGVLYSTEANQMLKCVPQAKRFEDGVLTIAEGTKDIAVRGIFSNQTIRKIVFPSTMTSILNMDSNLYFSIENCNSLAEVEVAEGNTAMYVEDNVVFANDENKTLLFFPPARVNEKNSEGKFYYKLPDGVKSIADYACKGGKFQIIDLNEVETIGEQAFLSTNLTEVSFSQNLRTISGGAFRSGNIQNFYMNGELTGESDYFSVQDGVIFSADKKVLIQFPLARTGIYEIPAITTNEIGEYAFASSKLTGITIPESVSTIGEYNQEIKGETNVEIIPVIA